GAAGGGGGRPPERRRRLVVEPETAHEPDLAGSIALGRERRERLLEARRVGQAARAVPDLTHPTEPMPSDPVSTFLACPSALPGSTCWSSTSTSASPTSGARRST